jgi:hypothetical protein
MIYCDLSVDGTIIWTGVPCLNKVSINTHAYLGFSGELFFYDGFGELDPEYAEFGARYFLVYAPDDTSDVFNIPLQAISAQTLNVVLGGQNCTLSIYYKDAPDLSHPGPAVSWDCPSVLVADQYLLTSVTVTAPAGCEFDWSIYIPAQDDANAAIFVNMDGYTSLVYPHVGGCKRVHMGVDANLGDLEITGVNEDYSFFMYLICDVYLDGGVTRLFQKITVTGSAVVASAFYLLNPYNYGAVATARIKDRMFYATAYSIISVWDGETLSEWSTLTGNMYQDLSMSDDYIYAFQDVGGANGSDLVKRAVNADPGDDWASVLTALEILTLVEESVEETVFPAHYLVDADGMLYIPITVSGDPGAYYLLYGEEDALAVIERTAPQDFAPVLYWAGPNQTVPGWVETLDTELIGAQYYYWEDGLSAPVELALPAGHVWTSTAKVYFTNDTWFFIGSEYGTGAYYIYTQAIGGAWVDVSSNFDETTLSSIINHNWIIPLSDGTLLVGFDGNSASRLDGSTFVAALVYSEEEESYFFDGQALILLGVAEYSINAIENICELEDGSIFFPCSSGG